MKRAEHLAQESGSVDDLRIRIWDYLYLLRQAQQIAFIAEQMHETPRTIEEAVDHPWFTQQDGVVAIAHTGR